MGKTICGKHEQAYETRCPYCEYPEEAPSLGPMGFRWPPARLGYFKAFKDPAPVPYLMNGMEYAEALAAKEALAATKLIPAPAAPIGYVTVPSAAVPSIWSGVIIHNSTGALPFAWPPRGE